MRLHVHQTLSALPIIPFASAGMVAGASLAHRLGLWEGDRSPADVLGWVAALGLMLGSGWVAAQPVQCAYDRLVAATCPACGKAAAYRRWPFVGRYRCRACGVDSQA